MPESLPYWRLSSFYLYYYGFLGAMLPFWGLYLRERGFGLTEIGSLMAILMATKVIAPNIWGWIADRTHKRLQVIRYGSVAAVVLFAGIFTEPGFWGVALVMAGFSFFWNAVMPQYEVLTLQHLGPATNQYSRIRVWGSVGFVLAVVGLGWYFEHFSIHWLPYVLILLLGLIAVASFMVSKAEPELESAPGGGGLRVFLKEVTQPQSLLFFTVCFLMQISHGPYYTFFSIFLEDFGYSKTAIGWLWALGVIAEIGIFMIVHQMLSHLSTRFLSVLCLVITAARWWATGAYPDQPAVILVAQLGHAASFGIFHALAIHNVNRFFSPKTAGQGQAFYSAFCFGAGGAAAAYLSGVVVESWGGSMAYFMAASVAVFAAVLSLFLATEVRRSKSAVAV